MGRDEIIQTLRRHEAELRAAGIQRLALFGSVARGDATPASDVDIVVAFDGARRYSMIDEERVRQSIADLLHADVDLAVEPLRKERLRERVEQERVRVF